jgi:hypothetical protein
VGIKTDIELDNLHANGFLDNPHLQNKTPVVRSFVCTVPELTRNSGIQLNARVALRCHRERVVIYYRTISRRPDPQWQSLQRSYSARRVVFEDDLRFDMPPRLQRCYWLVLDHAMPAGPAFFLTFLVLFLLIVNGLILLLR